MAFNPDQFLAETDPGGFNPDQFLEKTAPKTPERGFLENAGRATVNALPMIGGAVGGVLGTPADAIAGPLGNMAGAGIGGYLGTAAKNAINSYIDPDQAPKTLGAAVLDPVVGGATQGAMEGVGQAAAPYLAAGASKVSPAIRDYLEKLAETKMGKALGATKAAFRKQGADAIRETGRYALDNDLAGPLTSAEGMADRNAAVGQKAMTERQRVYDAIDAGGPNTPSGAYPNTVNPDYSDINPAEMTPRRINGAPEATEAQLGQMRQAAGVSQAENLSAANANAYNPITQTKPPGASQYNPLEAAQAIQKKVGSFNPLDPLDQSGAGQLNDTLKSVRLNGEANVSMAEAQAKQEQLQAQANFDATRPNASNSVAQDAAGAHREYLNQSAENAAGQIGGSNLKSTIQTANNQWSQGRKAAQLLNNRTASELGNKTFGLTDTIVGAGTGSLPLVGVKKTIEKYGNQNVALGADWLKTVVDKSPELLGRWAAPLTQAASRGGNSLPATDFIMQQTDPEYREHLRTLRGNPDEDNQ